MKNLLFKEFKLATHLLTYLFLGFSFMTFVPGYPILCGAFFVCLGMFQSYQLAREDNDILYSVLLPVKKTDIVKAKYMTAVVLEGIAVVICGSCTLIRMLFLSEAVIYKTNALMGANLISLAFVFIIFTVFNLIFIGGFFKTGYGIGKPFVLFIVVNFAIIWIGEALHYLPGFAWVNTLDFGYADRQICVLLVAILVYVIGTLLSCKTSQKRFEKIDL